MAAPETLEEYAARLSASAGPDGRPVLAPAGLTSWDAFPFEAEGLRVKAFEAPVETEPGRMGEDPATCSLGDCPGPASPDWQVIWRDEHWQLKAAPPSGLPSVLAVEPLAHHDLVDLPAPLAAEQGRLLGAVAAAVEELPTVGRCHVMRIGDGAVHLHWWFLGRPARLTQFRGSFNVVWDDIAPPIPLEVRDANAAFVVDRLVATLGGASLMEGSAHA